MRDDCVYEFAMIGHPGAGKTTLAAGLYKSVGDHFVALPSEAVTDYIHGVCAGLEGERWAPATQGEPKKLSYTVLHDHRKYQLRFNDFPGEKISEDGFIREVVKKEDGNYPDGVLLLVNCAARQMDDPLQKQEMETDFRKFVMEMAEHHVPIALVVTAWDRMSTDRKDRRDEFENFLKPLEVILKENKCRWKRFNVSVTGELEDQQHPKLAPNNVEKPFLWLLHQQSTMIRRRRVKIILLLILAALMAAAGIWRLVKPQPEICPTCKQPRSLCKCPKPEICPTCKQPQSLCKCPKPTVDQENFGQRFLDALKEIKRDDSSAMLSRWADVESEYKGKRIKGFEQEIDEVRREITLRIAQKIFGCAGVHNLTKVKEFCEEISPEDEQHIIPYLKDKKIMVFARNYKRWYNEYRVKVTVTVEPEKTDDKCKEVKIHTCKLGTMKCSDMEPKNWSHGKPENPGQPVATEVHINECALYVVECQSIYRRGWEFLKKNGAKEKISFCFDPTKDEGGEKWFEKDQMGEKYKGYKVKCNISVVPLVDNGFNPLLKKFMKGFGEEAEDLCEADRNDD